MSVIIYHNPKCTKSRETLQLLKDNGVTPVVVEYLKNPPSFEMLKDIVAAMGKKPRDIIRTKEPEYKEKKLDNPALTDDEILHILVEKPILIERPIVISNGKAVIGRPPENVLAII